MCFYEEDTEIEAATARAPLPEGDVEGREVKLASFGELLAESLAGKRHSEHKLFSPTSCNLKIKVMTGANVYF